MKKKCLIVFIIIIIVIAIFVAIKIINRHGVHMIIEGNNNYLMLEVTSSNWGLVSSSDDYWKNTKYKVYSNGQVKVVDNYNLSGEKNKKKYNLTDEKLLKLKDVLNDNFMDYDEDYSGADGTGWEFLYYNENKEIIHKFIGYIYENKTLNEIVDIISMNNENRS